MIKIENTHVVGWEPAIRGMRNPLNSWSKSDSKFVRDMDYGCSGSCPCEDFGDSCSCCYIGENDLKLAKKLADAGSVHGKFMRMITVYVDITAPLYWWKEFDQYKVGTVSNSCSTMHKIADKEFTLDDFSHEHLDIYRDNILTMADSKEYRFSSMDLLGLEIDVLNQCRKRYLKTRAKSDWWQLIQLLPSSYNQRRTYMLNYEVLRGIYIYRKDHKLDEWVKLCAWIKTLPYSELITGEEN